MYELTLGEAAASTGLSANTLRRRLRLGRLSGRKDKGGRWLVEMEGLREGPRVLALPRPAAPPAEDQLHDLRQLMDAVKQQSVRLRLELDTQYRTEADLRLQMDDLREERDRLWKALQQSQRLLEAALPAPKRR